jgi:CRISPR type III-B/RAMP module-associated protein Cmr3
MSWKLLRLTPLKPFFFGRDTVHANTHHAVSEHFPQQTQIAGALRLYWLEQNHLMRKQKNGKFVPYEKRNEAIELTGTAGSDTFGADDNLGRFNYISPMFVLRYHDRNLEDVLYPIPGDITHDYRITYPEILEDMHGSSSPILLHGYDAKRGFVRGLGTQQFWEKYRLDNSVNADTILSYETVFRPYDQPGIALQEAKQTVEEMFYTRRAYGLNPEYGFGIIVDIDEEGLPDDKKLRDGFITIGADGSMFRMKVDRAEWDLFDRYPILEALKPSQDNDTPRGNKLVVLSDSMMSESLLPDARFQIVAPGVAFRMLSREADAGQHRKTRRQLLVPRGSVYHLKQADALPAAQGAYAKMGFNLYLAQNQ